MKGAGKRSAVNIVRAYFPGVTSVMDARKGVRVEVNGRDVATSQRKNHEGCAMAVACKRAMKLDGVIIAMSTAYLIKGKKAIRFKVPESVVREVVSFDRGSQFETGSYELRAPSKHERLGTSEGGHTSHGHSDSKPLKKHIHTKNVRAVLGSENER